MMTIQKLAITPAAEWWLQIRPMVHEFGKLIARHPAKQVDNAAAIAHHIQRLYAQVENLSCPHEAEVLYAYLTRAMQYLDMCYEAAAQFQKNQVEVFYGRATSDWALARDEMRNIGAKAS